MSDKHEVQNGDKMDGADTSQMSRRSALGIIGGVSMSALLLMLGSHEAVADALQDDRTLSVNAQRAKITALNKGKKPGKEIPWNNKTLVSNLTEGLNDREARKKLFAFVQSFPYEVRHFVPRQGTELYENEAGDCRHKSDALYNLFKERGFEVRRFDVLFDWADLPIPEDILKEKKLSGTRAFHDAIEVKIDGKWTYVDPTWDLSLEKLGFPVTKKWDGVHPTSEVTKGKTVKIPVGTYKTFEALLAAHQVPWPTRKETDTFNTRLNAWLKEKRSR